MQSKHFKMLLTTLVACVNLVSSRDLLKKDSPCSNQPDGATISLSVCTDTYLRCLNGQANKETCSPVGTVYNALTGFCDWTSNVEGCSQVDNPLQHLHAPHPYLQALTGKMVNVVGGMPGSRYMLVSEHDSQVNVEIASTAHRGGRALYIKAVGFQHISGWTMTIDAGTSDSCQTGSTDVPTLEVTVSGRPLNTASLHPSTDKKGSTQVMGEAPEGIAFAYNVHQFGTELQYERIEVATPRVLYSIYRQPHSCVAHLDVDFQLLDPDLASEGDEEMHGLLGQTARWLWQPAEKHEIEGKIQDYAESDILSHDSPMSSYAPKGKAKGRASDPPADGAPVAVGGFYAAELPERW